MVHTAQVHRPEVRTIVLLTIVATLLPHHEAAIPAEAAVTHALQIAAVAVEAVHAHPVAVVEAAAVEEAEDKYV